MNPRPAPPPSAWKRFWAAVKPPPAAHGSATLGTPEDSRLRMFWSALKAPPPAYRPGEEVPIEVRRRRTILVAAAVAAVLIVIAAWQVRRYIAAAPQRAQAALREGMRQAAAGDYKRAVDSFSTSARILPGMAPAYLQRGFAHESLNQIDAAFADYQRAAQADPKLAAAHSALGGIYSVRKDWEHAMQEFTLAISLDPTVEALYGRGQVYESLGQHQKAIEDYTAAIAVLPDAPHVYLARATARTNIGDRKGAEEDARQAREIEHRSEPDHSNP